MQSVHRFAIEIVFTTPIQIRLSKYLFFFSFFSFRYGAIKLCDTTYACIFLWIFKFSLSHGRATYLLYSARISMLVKGGGVSDKTESEILYWL